MRFHSPRECGVRWVDHPLHREHSYTRRCRHWESAFGRARRGVPPSELVLPEHRALAREVHRPFRVLPLALLARYSGLSRQLNRFGDRFPNRLRPRAQLEPRALVPRPVDAPHVVLPIAQHQDVMQPRPPQHSVARLPRDNRQADDLPAQGHAGPHHHVFQPHRAVLELDQRVLKRFARVEGSAHPRGLLPAHAHPKKLGLRFAVPTLAENASILVREQSSLSR